MQKPETVILPPSRFSLHLKELWQYRELFYFFTWRDIKVKYKQTTLGVLWALIQPVSLMLLFTLIFSRHLRFDTGEMPYQIFVLSGLILWNLFNSSVSGASESMLLHADIIKKVFFPRLIIPGSSLLTSLFDFLIALIAFFVFCPVYNEWPTWKAIWLFPAAIILVIVSALGAGLFLSALNVKFRDFRYVVPFALQFLFFATQVVYPLHTIKQEWLRYALALHPVNGAIELFRSGFTDQFDTTIILISALSATLLIVMGLFYFKKTEAYFADLA